MPKSADGPGFGLAEAATVIDLLSQACGSTAETAIEVTDMTVLDTAPTDLVDRFGDLLLGIDYGDERLRPLLDVEGLHSWVEGRLSGYEMPEAATDRLAFYGPAGQLTAAGYQP